MSIKIYVYGCTSCGVTANYIMRIKSKISGNMEIYNSKYNKTTLEEHIEYLKKAGMDLNKYHNIVVEGNNVILLEEWKYEKT